ncbi:MAG: hypothetical protein DMF97_14505 [Acidobacteria bacterium]|nr:MAG: hypothetical protein DMF97_14505 [Acidobacteriota bacterium]
MQLGIRKLELRIREIQTQIPNSKFQILNSNLLSSASSAVGLSLFAAAVVATLGAATVMAGPPKDAVIPMAVHITSPLGRSGLPGKVRIVARIAAPVESPAAPPRPVRFFVNDKLIGTDTDGPPYSTEWEDENPFEPCKLAVEVDDPISGVVRDELDLAPIEIVEQSGITSVGLEATVQDAQGHYLGGLDASQFTLRENGEPQTIDVITSEAPAATFVLLVDSSQSMSRNIDFMRVAASRLVDHLRSDDSVVIAPFNKGITTVTGPSRDRATIADAVAAIKPHGGTAIIDALLEATEQFPNADGRRVVVLLTDGYDENSTKSFEETLARLKQTQVTVYTVAIGGVSGVNRRRHRRTRVLPVELGSARGGPHGDCRRCAAPVSDGLHADEPAAGRHVAHDFGDDERPGAQDSRPAGLSVADAAAGQGVDRIHRGRRRAAVCRSHARRSRRAGRRHQAERRRIPGSGRAGHDHAGAGPERQHEEGGARRS